MRYVNLNWKLINEWKKNVKIRINKTDGECNADNIVWMNDLRAPDDMQETFTECIAFTSEFHSPKKGGGAWNADTEYTGWKWWLARSDGGEWKLMTWGY